MLLAFMLLQDSLISNSFIVRSLAQLTFFPEGNSFWHLRVEVDDAFLEVEKLLWFRGRFFTVCTCYGVYDVDFTLRYILCCSIYSADIFI